MKKLIKNILTVTLPALIVVLILLEIVSRLFFPGTQPPSTIFDYENKIIKFGYENGKTGFHTIGKFSQQRSKWRINNDGWNSPFDYFPIKDKGKIMIAVIGDSYIEAFQVDYDKAFPSLLKNGLGDSCDVYSFGISGAPLSQYLHISRYANKMYHPDIFIFNIIHNDFDESITGLYKKSSFLTFNLQDDTIIETLFPYKRTYRKVPFSKLLKNSSLLRYLYGNLKINHFFKYSKTENKKFNANINFENVYNRKGDIRKVIKYFLDVIKNELADKRIIFIMDAPRDDIYNNALNNSSVIFLNDMMRKFCLENNFEFIDLTQSMSKNYKLEKIKFNSEIDGHWNEYGHRFVYEQIIKHLKKKAFDVIGK